MKLMVSGGEKSFLFHVTLNFRRPEFIKTGFHLEGDGASLHWKRDAAIGHK